MLGDALAPRPLGAGAHQCHAADAAPAHQARAARAPRGAMAARCRFASASTITARPCTRRSGARAPATRPSQASIGWRGNGFALAIAGRTCWGESEAELRERLCAPDRASAAGRSMRTIRRELVLLPEMDGRADVPEITTRLLGHSAEEPERHDVRDEPHGGEAKGRRAARRAALHAAPLRSGLRDGRDPGRGRARRRRHVRPRRRQALPPALREVLRARRRQLLGLSLCLKCFDSFKPCA